MYIALWTLNSLIASVILGLFLKIIEKLTTIKVYTLLLNIDYIPNVNRFLFPEWFEFLLHVIVGIILGNVLQWLLIKYKIVNQRAFIVIISVLIIVAISYYPVTILSARTPAFLSFSAFAWWCLGHLLYGLALWIGYNRIAKK